MMSSLMMSLNRQMNVCICTNALLSLCIVTNYVIPWRIPLALMSIMQGITPKIPPYGLYKAAIISSQIYFGGSVFKFWKECQRKKNFNSFNACRVMAVSGLKELLGLNVANATVTERRSRRGKKSECWSANLSVTVAVNIMYCAN